MSAPPLPSTTSLPLPPKKVSFPLPPMRVSSPSWPPNTRVGFAVVKAPLPVSSRIRSLPSPAAMSMVLKVPSLKLRSADPLLPMSTSSRFGWAAAHAERDPVPGRGAGDAQRAVGDPALTVVAAAAGAAPREMSSMARATAPMDPASLGRVTSAARGLAMGDTGATPADGSAGRWVQTPERMTRRSLTSELTPPRGDRFRALACRDGSHAGLRRRANPAHPRSETSGRCAAECRSMRPTLSVRL